MSKYRLAVVTSHPIQYQAPLFRLLAQHPQIDLTVYFGHDASINNGKDPGFGIPVSWDIPLLSGYRSVFLQRNVKSFDDPKLNRAYRQFGNYLRSEIYDAVLIHGYAGSFARWAFIGAWLSRTPIILHGESEIFSPRSKIKHILRSLYIMPFLKTSSAFLCIGHANRDFYRAYKVPEKLLFSAPYAVDNEFFQAEHNRLLAIRDDIRASMGFHPKQVVIVFSGKLIERKRPLDLLQAFRKICDVGLDVGLLYIGEGNLRADLEAEIARYGLKNVKFAGFLNQSEISRGYVCGDVFVLPSRYETWGLVVNEAMNFSMPVVVSDQVGAAPDLVRTDSTGYVFPFGQIDKLSETLQKVIQDPERRMVMGKSALELVNHYSFEKDVVGISAALNAIRVRTTLIND